MKARDRFQPPSLLLARARAEPWLQSCPGACPLLMRREAGERALGRCADTLAPAHRSFLLEELSEDYGSKSHFLGL